MELARFKLSLARDMSWGPALTLTGVRKLGVGLMPKGLGQLLRQLPTSCGQQKESDPARRDDEVFGCGEGLLNVAQIGGVGLYRWPILEEGWRIAHSRQSWWTTAIIIANGKTTARGNDWNYAEWARDQAGPRC